MSIISNCITSLGNSQNLLYYLCLNIQSPTRVFHKTTIIALTFSIIWTKSEDLEDTCFSSPCQGLVWMPQEKRTSWCQHPPGYSGLACETTTNSCGGNTCQHEGTFHKDPEHSNCIYPAGYAERFCEMDHKWLPTLITMGLCARMKTMATPASVWLYPAADRNRCIDTQPNIKQN